MKLSKRVVVLAALATAGLTLLAISAVGAGASRKAGPTYTVCIDIPFHPIFDYVDANAGTYFANKPYQVQFKILDATTQVPAFGAGQCNVMTTPPSFIPRVMQQYHLRVAEFFPMARWTIGPQLLVPKNSPYKTLESLKGQKVAIAPLSSRFGAEEAAVEAETGQNIRTYFKLEQTSAAAQELTLGHVAAAFLEAPSTYPVLQTGKFKAIWSVHDAFLKAFGDPAVVNGGYIARTGFITGASDFIHTLVASTEDAWNKYIADPSAVNDVASKQSGIPAAQLAVVGQVLDLSGMPAGLRKIIPRDAKTWSKIFPLLAKSGFIKQAPSNVASLFIFTK
jgi:hypothetical protein